jgi:16S rRNA (guanine966-N2)-methyltransferase
MRIIAGELGGRKLKSIDRPGLRPTTDRVRESIFSMLTARLDFEGIDVLDLFAGTGALGIEAISRGAATAQFVELDRRSVAVIEENLRTLGIAARCRVVASDAIRFLVKCDRTFDLILADPPYSAALFDQLVHEIFARNLLRPDGLFVLEHSSTLKPAVPEGVRVVVEKTFGETAVTVYAEVERV